MKPVCIFISIGVLIGGAILAILMIGGSDLLREWGKSEGNRNATDLNPPVNATDFVSDILERKSLSLNSTEVEPDEHSTNGNNSTETYKRLIERLAGKMKEDIVNTARTSGLTESRVVRGLEIAGFSLAIGIAVGAGICLLGPLVTCICLSCMGYQKPGVAYDSIAARMQSNIGNVETDSCFAACQSHGAKGSTPIQTIFITALVAGTLASIVSVIVMLSNE